MVSTDNDLGMNQFQIHASQIENFEKIVSQITRFPVEAIKPAGMTPQEQEFSTDFVLIKKDHRVHFKRMSAGEKKICKSFSTLLNMMHSLAEPTKGDLAMPGWPRILLIDNVELHVYYDRHVALIDCLKSVFSQQQIFTTTHSGTLITRYLDGENDQENEMMIDLEKIN
jgi:predicted ATP-dependent endonuclease of OLD family